LCKNRNEYRLTKTALHRRALIADKRDVTLCVNPPIKAGVIDIEATTIPSIVEHEGTCYLYQGLSGPTSVWTSADGIEWEPRARSQALTTAGSMWTSISSVFIRSERRQIPIQGVI